MDSDHQPQPPSPDVSDSELDSDGELRLVSTPRTPTDAAVDAPRVHEHPPKAQIDPRSLMLFHQRLHPCLSLYPVLMILFVFIGAVCRKT